MKKIYIGTSGWTYKDWHDEFYPKEIKKGFLTYYATEFNSVEINSTFYRIPPDSMVRGWDEQTPRDFIFTFKLNRYITHIKKLVHVKETMDIFFKRLSLLKKKARTLLIQLPPSLAYEERRINDFIKTLKLVSKKYKDPFHFALEPRHTSWFEQDVVEKLRKQFKKEGIALVFSQSSEYPGYEPIGENITSDFVYMRLHGPKELFASPYSVKELKLWAERIRELRKK
ncbi:DUF72 domain-containing protein, partial [Candidatus Parcubacteria bacterium]|nr:DUF72 domain-containing protein [Candidatus Parcubacteria bacterium]